METEKWRDTHEMRKGILKAALAQKKDEEEKNAGLLSLASLPMMGKATHKSARVSCTVSLHPLIHSNHSHMLCIMKNYSYEKLYSL